MKRMVSVVIVVLMLSLLFTGLAAANEAPDTQVSREAEVTTDENAVKEEPVAEEPVPEEDYVGKDMELKDGEAGIVSLPAGSDQLERQSGVAEDAASGNNNLPLYGGIFAAAVVAFVVYKKVLA